MNIQNTLLSKLLQETITADRPVPPVNPALTRDARDAAHEARHRALIAADGWLPVPQIGNERTRQRAVRTLIDKGLLIEHGEKRARLVKLTDVGYAAAEAMR